MQKKYKALIIGAGRIASGFDNPKNPLVLTHAHAYYLQKKIHTFGFYDTDNIKANIEAKKWSVSAYKTLEEALRILKPEIISICTPDFDHFKTIEKVLMSEHKPGIIICEKPLTFKVEDNKKLSKLLNKHGIKILVDHTRRFDKDVQKISKNLHDGKYGSVISASAHYGKGVVHNGTHIIDLARYFFGEVKDLKVLYSHKDFQNQTDQTVSAYMVFESCPQFFLIAGNEKYYSYFQFEILCEKRKICFYDLGFSVLEQEVINDPIYPGYTILGKSKSRKTNFDFAMMNLVENAINHIEKDEPLICDSSDACKTQSLCLRLQSQSLKL